MTNPENLRPKPWKPGVSGNPAGKPKGALNRKTLLRKWLEVTSKNGTVEDDIALALIAKALQGDVNAIKEVFDSTHGKVTDKLEKTGPDGGPLSHEVTVKVITK